MALGDDEGKPAQSIQAMLHQIFEQTIFPQLKRAVELAESATARAEAAETLCARVEQALQEKTTFEIAKLQEAVGISLQAMKPTFERMATTLAEATRKNEALAKACIELGNQNKRLLFLKYADTNEMGKPS